jgi:hypothetical protein
MKNILDWVSFNEGYNKPRAGGKRRWSVKYKKKIDCSNPKGFSQKQYCRRKRRGGAYKNESVNNSSIKTILEHMFYDLTDLGSWFVWVDEYSVFSKPHDYEVYISFGDTEPYNRFEDDYLDEKQIPEELINSIELAINFMKEEGYQFQILLCDEYSADPSEDYKEEIDISDLSTGQWLSENQSIRIKFS